MYVKLICIIRIFLHFLINSFIIFLHISFRIFYFVMFNCLYSLAIILLLCVSVTNLHVSCLLLTNFNESDSSSGSVFCNVHISIDKGADYLQSNNNASSNDLWLRFSTLIIFLGKLV